MQASGNRVLAENRPFRLRSGGAILSLPDQTGHEVKHDQPGMGETVGRSSDTPCCNLQHLARFMQVGH